MDVASDRCRCSMAQLVKYSLFARQPRAPSSTATTTDAAVSPYETVSSALQTSLQASVLGQEQLSKDTAEAAVVDMAI